MTSPLSHELANHLYLRQRLEEEFPDTDEETLLGTLEGLTNLNEMLSAVVRSQLDDVALATGLRGRMDDMRQRLTRLDEGVRRKRPRRGPCHHPAPVLPWSHVDGDDRAWRGTRTRPCNGRERGAGWWLRQRRAAIATMRRRSK